MPAFPASSWSQDEWDTFYTAQMARAKARQSLIKHYEIRHFGTIDEFTKEGQGRVVLLKTIEGGHNMIGSLEGVQEVIRHSFNFDWLIIILGCAAYLSLADYYRWLYAVR